MKIRINDLMSTKVIKLKEHLNVEQARSKFLSKGIKSAPVVDSEDYLLGVISLSDILDTNLDKKPISSVMTKKVYSIPEYEGVEIAARMMKNHKIHHLIVTKEKKVIGVISSFDLLQLIEGKKFVMKNSSTPKKRGGSQRRKQELIA
jgi:predicted transcriptional regulator